MVDWVHCCRACVQQKQYAGGVAGESCSSHGVPEAESQSWTSFFVFVPSKTPPYGIGPLMFGTGLLHQFAVPGASDSGNILRTHPEYALLIS